MLRQPFSFTLPWLHSHQHAYNHDDAYLYDILLPWSFVSRRDVSAAGRSQLSCVNISRWSVVRFRCSGPRSDVPRCFLADYLTETRGGPFRWRSCYSDCVKIWWNLADGGKSLTNFFDSSKIIKGAVRLSPFLVAKVGAVFWSVSVCDSFQRWRECCLLLAGWNLVPSCGQLAGIVLNHSGFVAVVWILTTFRKRFALVNDTKQVHVPTDVPKESPRERSTLAENLYRKKVGGSCEATVNY